MSETGIQARRAALEAIFGAAVAAAHPAGCLPPHLPEAPPNGRLIVLAAGKAGGSMAEVAEAHYRERGVDPARIAGLAVARHGYGRPLERLPMIEAGHPVPDAGSVAGAGQALDLAAAAGPDDLVLVLLSGGASANWVAPAGALTLEEKRAITRHLLRSGAAIDEINAIRKRLSRIKGGRLARAAHPARLLTLAISDVPGDDPAVIGSGPTVADPVSNAEALAIAERYATPLGAARALFEDPANETPKPGDPVFARSAFRIVMTPAEMLAAAATAAAAQGYVPLVLGADLEGEAREVAAAQARLAREALARGGRTAILSGGELTVTIRGQGRGGPNQEFALALAVELGGLAGVSALAADTDGTDGGAGAATDPAGAVVDETTLARAGARGLDPAGSLADNDSTGFFEALGDLVAPGPTFTNVNDLRVILVDGTAA
ncbi:glycerate kinase type-2 family protein [Labrys wisconsinensis]|uniref:Hydroxypyruvate reductase n=1 Tax=Labrys wisconsinensis TaxID=425677 RepID=A0ABU0JNQ1_9HYPH|nr:glycerate kinase [Labrys wisconsinensis]MDQ0475126.1 hydroxypyruvate reductase [Labrys wisconsinensis]